MRSGPSVFRLLAASIALAVLHPDGSRAEGLQLRYEPLFAVSETTATDPAGNTQRTSSTAWNHRWYLQVDKTLYPYLRFDGNGNYEWSLGSGTTDGRPTEFSGRTWNLNAQLTAGPRELNASPFYSRRQSSFDSLDAGALLTTPTLVSETAGAYGNWRPEGLPSLSLRFVRTDQHDEARTVTDVQTNELALESIFVLRAVDLRYRFQYLNPVDRVAGVDTSNLRHEGRVAYGDRYFSGRINVSASYLVSALGRETRATGTGGTVAVRQLASAGLSIVEAFPATPARVTLLPTPALVDGDRATSVGINLGFGRTASGDAALRDLGGQFAIAAVPVNTIWVWVDRPLPASTAAGFVWTAYRSDDNLDWTPVPAGAVTFDAFQNRFEIPIERTSARYLKVVTRPLAGTVPDPRFNDILVTELEFYDVVPASAAQGSSSDTGGVANAAVRARLLPDANLYYDFAVYLTHSHQSVGATDRGTTLTYNVLNGISYDRPLGRALTISTRLDRTDFDELRGHEALNRFSASLGASPLAALASTLTYNAQVLESAEGRAFNQAVLLFVQAEPYRGVALLANLGYGAGSPIAGQTSRSRSASLGVTVTPHRALILSGTYAYQAIASIIAAEAEVERRNERLEGTATFTPIPALFLSASIGRLVVEDRPQRIANVAANVRPFPAGNLYLAFNYNESFDSLFDQRTRTMGPSARWNIHAGNFLDLSYTVQDTTSTLASSRSSLLAARLTLTL
jgi:hypothetical protein